MSIVSRTFAEVGNAIKDAFGHVVHGDDAGTYETKVIVIHPKSVKINGERTRKYDLGMSFLNVNDRAFVKMVKIGSDAALEGLQAQDCLQVAIILGGSKRLDRMQHNKDRAIDFGLECEKSGHRTSFDELKLLFENCSLDVNSTGFQVFDSSVSDRSSEDTATISRRIRTTTQEMVGRCSGLGDPSLLTLRSNSFSEAEYPVVLVFRQTHKRHVRSTPHVGMPYFRLDDECERAALIIRRLAPTVGVQADPDAWDEIMESASKYFSPNGKHLILDEVLSDEDAKRDVEVETIRGMIQNALGLAFIRTSKVVLGVSFHFGSGIVISRLPDETWSAPSAIGMYGAGLGVQFGLEVADYIFILQTEEALDHFRQGSNYTIGGNMGAAMGGVGREAYGAASVGSPKMNKARDKRKVAPLVAYAKSQGLYFGVSLEGSKIFAREDINRRAYKFTSGKECSTDDILSGRVPAPLGAEDLYSTLHSVEFAHEMTDLPRPPKPLMQEISKDWDSYENEKASRHTLGLTNLAGATSNECAGFEASFKIFLCGGVSVQCVSPKELEGGNVESLERRIFWLALHPEFESWRIGYISQNLDENDENSVLFSEGGTHDSDEHTAGDVSTDEITTDSRSTMNSTWIRKVKGNVKLSKKHSMKLSDVVSLKRISTNAGNPNDDAKEMRVIRIVDKYNNTLRFVSNTVREVELLTCGLKLLLERQVSHVSARGGIASKEKGVKTNPKSRVEFESDRNRDNTSIGESEDHKSALSSNPSSEFSSDNQRSESPVDRALHGGHKSWHQVPIVDRARTGVSVQQKVKTIQRQPRLPHDVAQHTGVLNTPKYSRGEQLISEIASNVKIPLPLPFLRVLFLDATSPLMKRWENDRGDTNYSRTAWNFPQSSLRSADSDAPMNELLSKPLSMKSGHRTILFDRLRNGRSIRLSDTHVVIKDDDKNVILSISERMPRRGFSTNVRITLLKETSSSTSISIFGDVVPIGEDLSNQGAVHRAFLLVIDELKRRYGSEDRGLLAGLTRTVATFPTMHPQKSPKVASVQNSLEKTDMKLPIDTFSSNSFFSEKSTSNVEVAQTPRRKERQKHRPSTPSLEKRFNTQVDNSLHEPLNNWATSDFVEWADMTTDDSAPSRSDVTIDVKPLPKLRLDLMPAPREEDEDESSAI